MKEPRAHPYIEHRSDVANGKAIIAGTRIKVSEIALQYEQFGWTPNQVIDACPHLTLAQVHDALSYYYENQAEVDAELKAEREIAAALNSQYGSLLTSKAAPLTMVWVFNGSHANFPSGVFSTFEAAHEWIKANSLSGVLTKYPVDMSAYEWVIRAGNFTPKKEKHFTPEFIESFSSASQDHYHYDNGVRWGE